jgi:hypothetical protein
MRFENKLFPLGCQEMIAKGSHIRDGGAAEEALKPQLSGFQVSSLRGHGELGKEPIGADRKMRRGAGPHYSSLTAKGRPTHTATSGIGCNQIPRPLATSGEYPNLGGSDQGVNSIWPVLRYNFFGRYQQATGRLRGSGWCGSGTDGLRAQFSYFCGLRLNRRSNLFEP